MYAYEQIFKKDLLDNRDANQPDYAYSSTYANLPCDAIVGILSRYQIGRNSGDVGPTKTYTQGRSNSRLTVAILI